MSVWPGALVRDSGGALYLIDGATRKIPTAAIGTGTRVQILASAATLDAIPTATP